MNAISLLTQDHRNVEQLFNRFEAAESPEEKRSLTDKVIEQLSIHAELEEQFFYPAVAARAEERARSSRPSRSTTWPSWPSGSWSASPPRRPTSTPSSP
jgi:hemerythrin superfamily protein